jgi:molybdenum cofactor cytidylyltransferase
MIEIGSVSRPIGGVVLAAGASRRMGKPKQLLQFRGSTILRRVVEEALASSLSRVLVVVGAHAPVAAAALRGLPVGIIENVDWAQGQGSSVATGVRALRERAPDTTGVVLLLSDQPLVTASSIDLLITTHRTTGTLIVCSRRGDRLEAPALFSFAFFDELAALRDDAGSREILTRNESRALGIDLPDAEFDIDTPEDYQRLINLDQEQPRRDEQAREPDPAGTSGLESSSEGPLLKD